MKRVALLAGVIALGAVLYFALHRSSHSDSTPAAERTADRAPAAARTITMPPVPQLVAPVAKPDDVEHANVVGLPEPLEPGYLAVERAAKGCYRGHATPQPIRPGGPDETIESIQLSYRQVASHGAGHAEDVRIVTGKLSDQALQDCIVAAAGAVMWSSSAPDGAIGDLQQNVNVGDLMRPDYGLPPESKRSPKPTAPPPPELAGALGGQAAAPDDHDHPGTVVSEPALSKRPK